MDPMGAPRCAPGKAERRSQPTEPETPPKKSSRFNWKTSRCASSPSLCALPQISHRLHRSSTSTAEAKKARNESRPYFHSSSRTESSSSSSSCGVWRSHQDGMNTGMSLNIRSCIPRQSFCGQLTARPTALSAPLRRTLPPRRHPRSGRGRRARVRHQQDLWELGRQTGRLDNCHASSASPRPRQPLDGQQCLAGGVASEPSPSRGEQWPVSPCSWGSAEASAGPMHSVKRQPMLREASVLWGVGLVCERRRRAYVVARCGGEGKRE
eukprot:scaffold7067_cov245-Pinguiococcus_pyrenoidosus.AAC.4